MAAKELYYHKPEIKACLQIFKRQYNQAFLKSERSTHDGNDDTHWIKVNALNTIYLFMFEVSMCRGVLCKGLRKNMLENSLGTRNSI